MTLMDGQISDDKSGPTQLKPGDTISPRSSELPPVPPAPEPSSIPEVTLPPVEPANTSAEPAPVLATTSQPATAALPPASQPVQLPSQPAEAVLPTGPAEASLPPEAPLPPADPSATISWTASEFIAHHKNGGWYGLLLLGACVAAVLVWLVTKDWVSIAVVILAAIILAGYASRQPRQLTYQLDPSGISIGPRHFSFNDFRSFSIVPEGAFASLVFTPLKRFGVPTTVYYDPQDEDRILDIIGSRLPHEEHRGDMVESLMRRIRF